MLYDVLIVGGGPAGLTAALYAARSGMKVVLFEGAFAGGQASTTDQLCNYPGFPDNVGGPELMAQFERQAKNAGAEIRYEEVTALSLEGAVKKAETASGAYEAKTAILAMGAKRRKLDLPNEDVLTGNGLSYCATCDGALYRGRPVAVVGGGNTAVEDAVYLASESAVHLIHRRDKLRASGRQAERLLALPNVTPHLNSAVEAIAREEGGLRMTLKNLATGEREDMSVAACFVAVGTVPNTELVRGALTLDKEGYIRAGEDTRTSIPGVFCAGDVREKPLKQVVTAVSDGAVAASMALRDMS